ncbi:MAG: hypothetical protein R3B84_03665 [Zavarzinella sp.]
MKVEGTIEPDSNISSLSREPWCQLVDRRAELPRPEPRQAINPFTCQSMTIRPTPDVALVILNGECVGDVSWSMDEDVPLVIISVEQVALSLVLEWTKELGGKFIQYSRDEDA